MTITPEDLAALDPGIRTTVQWLNQHFFTTTDSGDGVSKTDLIATGDALDMPHVFMTCDPEILVAQANRLELALASIGIEATSGTISASYDPVDRIAVIMLLGVNDEMLQGRDLWHAKEMKS